MHAELVDDRTFNSFILWSHIMPLRIILISPLFEYVNESCHLGVVFSVALKQWRSERGGGIVLKAI